MNGLAPVWQPLVYLVEVGRLFNLIIHLRRLIEIT